MDCTYYRGGWHVSYPLLIRQPFYSWQKPRKGHSKFLCHTFVYCRIFAPAAPRRARVLISVPFSGLPLSRPVWIFGLVGSYPANYLIHRSPILKRKHLHGVLLFGTKKFPLILREIAAIRIRLSHASQRASSEAQANCSVTRR